MSDYIYSRDTPVLNNLVLGASLQVAPEIQTMLETQAIRENIEQLAQQQMPSLETVQHNIQQTVTGVGEALYRGVRDVETAISNNSYQLKEGFGGLQHGITNLAGKMGSGFEGMRRGIQEMGGILATNLQQGFYHVNSNLKEGFQGVTKAVYISNAVLGEQVIRGFNNVAIGQQQLTQVTDAGFQRVSQQLAKGFSAQIIQSMWEGEATRAALGKLANTFSAEQELLRLTLQYQHEELSNILMQGFNQTLALIAQEGLLQRQSLQQLHQDLHAIIGKLDKIDDTLKHLPRHHANEDFLVGMRYLPHLWIDAAQKQFQRAIDKFGGHFPSWLMLGYIALLEQDLNAAKQYFYTARIHAGHNGNQAQEQATADLYLARIAFTENNYQLAYDTYSQAYETYPTLLSALIEGATAHLLNQQGSSNAIQQITTLFKKRYGFNEYQCWYALALELSPHQPDWALDALRKGLKLHTSAQQKQHTSIWAILTTLNSRYVGILLKLVKTAEDLKWLWVRNQ